MGKKTIKDEFDEFERAINEIPEVTKKMSEAYTKIGHSPEHLVENSLNEIWVYKGGKIHSKLEKFGSHKIPYGDEAYYHWRGRFDHDRNIVTIAPPDFEVDLYRTVEVPHRLLNLIGSNWEGAEIQCFGGASIL